MISSELLQKFQKIAPTLTLQNRLWYEERFKTPVESSGWVYYRYKKETKYPARIYVFVNGDKWKDRNLGAMGLRGSTFFLKRPMTKGELEDAHFYTRLRYYQYEKWDHLLEHEEEIFLEWENEDQIEVGKVFLQQLKKLSKNYQIGMKINNVRGEK